ncbi:hypothetical protein TIFTF001_003257 [Ficus carica]|uniref:Bidirectional sugar transporter SWEET n=1 Tax=Ficus carica TaxID=3494 RepID=A0AA87ZYL2_FICCA|nr:hypothetical protein TIFTF001_003257 [Ficus carica]
MVSAEAARTVVGIIGNIIALFFFLSPAPTFVRIWKKGAVEQYSPIPYLATLINCMLWTLYALPVVQPGSLLVLTISATGLVIEIVYIILFLTFSDKKMRLKVLLAVLVEIMFTALLAFLTLTLVPTRSKRATIVGILCIFSSTVMYSSPLAILSVEFMPFYLSLATFVNGLVWTAYALIRLNPIIIVPNGLGALFGLTQLILYALYYKSTKRLTAARKEKDIQVSMSMVVVVNEAEGEAKKTHISLQNESEKNGI